MSSCSLTLRSDVVGILTVFGSSNISKASPRESFQRKRLVEMMASGRLFLSTKHCGPGGSDCTTHAATFLFFFSFFFFRVCQESVIRETGSDGFARQRHTRLTVMDCHAKGSGDDAEWGRKVPYSSIEWVKLDFYCLLHIIDTPWGFIRVDTWEWWERQSGVKWAPSCRSEEKQKEGIEGWKGDLVKL